MKPLHTNPPVSGTLFFESTSGKDRRSLSASLRGGRPPVSYVPARYTFVYENRDGEWLIAHYHSSLRPVS